ncbi:MAG TPA: substrate-binding domain-containing protein [Candidatus Corynebacterium avicola]|uniref:Substrate-binding domain-containing protein n=1 Tax=Candidatus Corynebacterium avicola TaxID=2838527 RepID=A0A9D1RPJ6_9CORY|nr:substrate-binding domain-containing protein [Candidatus Corynebacterium avicola]
MFQRRTSTTLGVLTTAGITLAALTACGDDNSADGDSGSGTITVSGSATVAPITSAVARDTGVDVDQSTEGSIAGFERFCTGETHINNASESIPGPGEETDFLAMCEENGVDFVELPVALDTITLIRHADNDLVNDLTAGELQAIWEPDSDITTWSDVRDDWPEEEINLIGRGPGSGTFDYFTRTVTGTAGEIRDDYTAVDDPTELNEAVAEDPYALGFTGVGSYLEDADNRDQLSTISVDGVEPSLEDAQDGSYGPLARPLFIYVSTEALDDSDGGSPDVEGFVGDYLDRVADLLPSTYFYPLPDEAYEQVQQRFSDRTTGSLTDGEPVDGATLLDEL